MKNARAAELLITALLLIPVFFIYRHVPVDWGDDNFQYLSQARNLSEGRFTTRTQFIYKAYADGMGPPAYPSGFPVLIAIARFFTGNLLAAARLVIAVSLFLSGLFLFLIARRWLHFLTSVSLVLVFIYNPYMLQLKSEIMSDIPYLCFSLAAIYFFPGLWLEKKKGNYLVAAWMAVIAVSIRSIGWAWVLAVYGVFVAELLKTGFRSRQVYRSMFRFSLPLFFFYGLYSVLLPADTGSTYSGQLLKGSMYEKVTHNLRAFYEMWAYYFSEQPFYVSGIIVLVFLVAGCIYVYGKRAGLLLLYLTIHLAILIFAWPHFSYRYYMPVLPLLLFLALAGSELMAGYIPARLRYVPVFILTAGLLVFSYFPEYQTQSTFVRHADGPFCPECGETWEQVSKITGEGETIAFHRPRALVFLVQRPSFILPHIPDTAVLKKELSETGCRYLLKDHVYTEYQQGIDALIEEDAAEMVWHNSRFSFYHIRY